MLGRCCASVRLSLKKGTASRLRETCPSAPKTKSSGWKWWRATLKGKLRTRRALEAAPQYVAVAVCSLPVEGAAHHVVKVDVPALHCVLPALLFLQSAHALATQCVPLL